MELRCSELERLIGTIFACAEKGSRIAETEQELFAYEVMLTRIKEDAETMLGMINRSDAR